MRPNWKYILPVVCWLAAVIPARAADRHWNVGSGLWSQSASWTPGGVPSGLDTAIIDFWNSGAGTGGFARLNTASVGAITSVTVSNGATLALSGTLNAGSLLVGTDVLLGTKPAIGAAAIALVALFSRRRANTPER
jgi:hypothetical protein